jgi:hypothetical protein
MLSCDSLKILNLDLKKIVSRIVRRLKLIPGILSHGKQKCKEELYFPLPKEIQRERVLCSESIVERKLLSRKKLLSVIFFANPENFMQWLNYFKKFPGF